MRNIFANIIIVLNKMYINNTYNYYAKYRINMQNIFVNIIIIISSNNNSIIIVCS